MNYLTQNLKKKFPEFLKSLGKIIIVVLNGFDTARNLKAKNSAW